MQLKAADEAVSHAEVASHYPAVSQLLGSAEERSTSLPPGIAANGVSTLLSNDAERRFRRELAWLEVLPGLSQAASTVLAVRAVACMMAIHPHKYPPPPTSSALTGLTSVRPELATLKKDALALLPQDMPVAELSDEDLARIDALWPLTAPTEYLLASGGDDRLSLDPVTGLNRYGCTPWPRPELVSFGSCTASSLSEGAFEAAEGARRALAASALATSPATALAEASDAISTALLRYFGVEDLAQAVLAASGTDAALVVTGLLAAEHPGETLTSILVNPSETGSGVPHAVQGRHFASSAPSGSLVGKGEPIEGLSAGPTLVTVALRDQAGAARPMQIVDAEFESAIRSGTEAGRVVLHAMDGSKTGLTAPDRASCRRLARIYGSKLDIVIDACQARIEPSMVRWYLQQGFPVLITGSKFFAAPGFCGAVLFPRLRLQRITRSGRLPAGLAAYARLQGGFGSRRCPGLILRWTAALHEMAVFGQVPARLVASTLDYLGRAVCSGIEADKRLALVGAPRPSGMGWSDRRSVFTFTVRGTRGLMSPGELRTLYKLLGEEDSGSAGIAGVPGQIGQPVELGRPEIGGLRIAISSAQIASSENQRLGLTIIFDKLRVLLDTYCPV